MGIIASNLPAQGNGAIALLVFGRRSSRAVLEQHRSPKGERRSTSRLDVATGGGHTALWLARHGWEVTAGDIALRMLENAQKLCAEEGYGIETRLFPAEEMPFVDGSFDLATVRVAPHHFSSPETFVRDTARVLTLGGHFLLIDGTVPDDDS